jgi:D-alanine transaminase
MREVYLNGQFLPEDQAKVSIFDRSLLFADSVYEVTSIVEGKLIDFKNHMKRLDRSMKELGFEKSLNHDEILNFHRQLIKLNNLNEGIVYLQVTRGVFDRDFTISQKNISPTVFAFTQEKKIVESESSKKGIKVMTVDDLRWKRCDIKTTQLLWPSLAKTEAFKKGFDDAWMMREGYIMEGTSNNAWIVRSKNVFTRQSDQLILSGITREAVLNCAKNLGYEVIFKNFTLPEVESATEAFITSATSFVTPVIQINEKKIGEGEPGEFTKALRAEYIKQAIKSSI